MSAQAEKSFSGFTTADKASGIRAGEIVPPALEVVSLPPEVLEDSKPDVVEKTQNVSNRYNTVSTLEPETVYQRDALPNWQYKMKAVYYAVLRSEYPIGPKEIHVITGVNYNTCRTYCQRLSDAGYIRPKSRGQYIPTVSIETHGYADDERFPSPTVSMVSPPLLFQNIYLTKIQNSVSVGGSYDFSLHDCSASLSYGVTHSQWNLSIKSSHGIDFQTVDALVLVADNYLTAFVYPAERLSVDSSASNCAAGDSSCAGDWQVALIEPLVDIPVKFEGLPQCSTWQAIRGDLIKVYEKSYGTRVEARLSNLGPLKSVMDSVSSYGSNIRIAEKVGALEDRVGDIHEGIKSTNAQNYTRFCTLERKLDLLLARDKGSSP